MRDGLNSTSYIANALKLHSDVNLRQMLFLSLAYESFGRIVAVGDLHNKTLPQQRSGKKRVKYL